MWHSGAETSARERFAKLRDAEHKVSLNRVTNGLAEMYQGLRTIALLPGVRRLSRHGENLSEDSASTIRELYFLLHSKLKFSEVHIVPIDFDPERPDITTRSPEAPLATFAEYVATSPAGAGAGHHAGDADAEESEFQLMAEQAKFLRKSYTT